jgi:hypothetical protein
MLGGQTHVHMFSSNLFGESQVSVHSGTHVQFTKEKTSPGGQVSLTSSGQSPNRSQSQIVGLNSSLNGHG